MTKVLFVGLLACSSLLAARLAHAESKSPIFGQAAVQLTTPSQNKNVIAKGYYADLYGYYGNYYASLAVYYGTYASYNKIASDYNSAASYAYTAYQDYSSAYSYQRSGQ